MTADGSLVFYHGPDDSGPAWTHYAPAPHPSGTVLARSEPATYEFIFHFDRNWTARRDVRRAVATGPGAVGRAPSAPAAPGTRALSLGNSRFYRRAALRGSPTDSDGGRESESGEAGRRASSVSSPMRTTFRCSICSAPPGREISLYGATTLTLPYADLAEVAAWKNRRRWLLRHRWP